METNRCVIIVDDDEASRQSVGAVVAAHSERAITFESAEAFLADYQPPYTGCIITDVRMPGMSGMELLHRIIELDPTLPIIIVTGHGDIPMAVEAMQSGAFTFLTKPTKGDLLWKTIIDAFAENDRRRQNASEVAEIKKRFESLTDKEKAVFYPMISGRANKQISSELDISIRTVETRRSLVFEKMGTASLAELVRLASRANLIPEASSR